MEQIVASNIRYKSWKYLALLHEHGLRAYAKDEANEAMCSSQGDIFLVFDRPEELKKAVELVAIVDAELAREQGDVITCPFCGREIPRRATICRYCLAEKRGDKWYPPRDEPRAAKPPRHPARFTIRTAAVFFFISAVLEGAALTDKVPLFGAVRGGAVAAGYHLLYAALFLAFWIGLWRAKSWGYRLMVGGTIFYTLDRLLYLFDRHAREADLLRQLQGFGGIEELVDPHSIYQLESLATVVTIACWWGFLLYLHWRRSYFENP